MSCDPDQGDPGKIAHRHDQRGRELNAHPEPLQANIDLDDNLSPLPL